MFIPQSNYITLRPCKNFNVKPELETFEWDTFNPDCLIRISNVDTLISCLIHSSLDIVQKNQKSVFKN